MIGKNLVVDHVIERGPAAGPETEEDLVAGHAIAGGTGAEVVIGVEAMNYI